MSCITQQIEKLVSEANFSLRPDVKKSIQKAYKQEKQKRAKLALRWILDNAKIAKRDRVALCQDTGLPLIFIEAGGDIELTASLICKIKSLIVKSYRSNSLRQSVVDPFQRKNPSYKGVIDHIQFSPNLKGLRITFFPKGFGCENKTRLKMFNPTVGISQIEDFVVESIKKAGPESCPPFFVGVGIGGTSEYALYLAKQALTDKIDSSNRDKNLNRLESKILQKINKLGIGPMGLGGRFTALGVKIRKHPTHIAGLPVGVNISCHALRSATVRIKNKIM